MLYLPSALQKYSIVCNLPSRGASAVCYTHLCLVMALRHRHYRPICQMKEERHGHTALKRRNQNLTVGLVGSKAYVFPTILHLSWPLWLCLFVLAEKLQTDYENVGSNSKDQDYWSPSTGEGLAEETHFPPWESGSFLKISVKGLGFKKKTE